MWKIYRVVFFIIIINKNVNVWWWKQKKKKQTKKKKKKKSNKKKNCADPDHTDLYLGKSSPTAKLVWRQNICRYQYDPSFKYLFETAVK